MNFVMSLDIDEFIQLIIKALEKREERKAWEMWLMNYQHMTKDNFVAFSEFFRSLKQPISKRPAEEILKEAEEIREQIRQKEGER